MLNVSRKMIIDIARYQRRIIALWWENLLPKKIEEKQNHAVLPRLPKSSECKIIPSGFKEVYLNDTQIILQHNVNINSLFSQLNVLYRYLYGNILEKCGDSLKNTMNDIYMHLRQLIFHEERSSIVYRAPWN